MRSWVERGSMPYSAVIQPLPEPLRKGGAFFFQTGGDQHMSVAELNQAGTLGMASEARRQADSAHLVVGADLRDAWEGPMVEGAKVRRYLAARILAQPSARFMD